MRVLFFLCVALFSVGLYLHNIVEFQQDLGRHLLIGKIIWEAKSVPHVNLLSYTHPDFQFINSHWLSEVIFYLLSQTSLNALTALKVIVMSAAVLLTVFTSLRQSKSLLATALAFVIFSPVLLERTAIRPEIFSYLFIAIFIYLVSTSLPSPPSNPSSHYSLPSSLWLIPAIQLLWVNLHIYFILGPILVGFLLLTKFRNSKYWLLLGLTLSACLVNPNFINGALYPFRVFENYGYTIVENQNIFFLESLGVFNPNILYFKIALIAFTFSFLITNLRRLSPLSILISTFIVLPLLHIRSFPLTFFLLLPVFASNLASPSKFALSWLSRWQSLRQIALILLICLIALRSFRLVTNDYYLSIDSEKRFGSEVVEAGKEAVGFFFQNKLSGPIFNNFDIGGYLAYRLYPNEKLFIDNRPEAYPADFIQNVYVPMQTSRENFDTVDKIYSFKTIIFAHTDGTPWGEAFLEMIYHHPDWSLVYFDDYAVVYIKNPVPSSSSPILLSHLPQPFSRSYLSYLSLGRFFSLIGQDDLAKQSFQKAHQLNPNSPLTNRAMNLIYPSLYKAPSSLPLF